MELDVVEYLKLRIMKEQVLLKLLTLKQEWENKVAHAIQNQFNPYADDGTARLKECREELARIDKQILELLKT